MYVSGKDSCESTANANLLDFPCLWIYSADGNSGKCFSNSSAICTDYNNKSQCIGDDNRKCLWDRTNEKCKGIYYVKSSGGLDSAGCTSYESACSTIDYIMTTIMNNSNSNDTVYIDKGVYDYKIASNSPSTGFSKFILNLTGYIDAETTSHVIVGDVSTYPVINTSNNDSNSSFYFPFNFVSDVFCSFSYLLFFIPNTGLSDVYYIHSLLCFIYFIYVYL
jgi:hypothetical protein